MSKGQTVSRNSIQKYRSSPDNLYFYLIREFHNLSEYEQEVCFRRMYILYLSGVRGLTYDEFRMNIINRKGKYKLLAFFKERTFNTDIGFAFSSADEIYYKENDFSKENTYLVSFDLSVLLPHFSGSGLLLALFSIGRRILMSQFPGFNILGFQRVANPSAYEIACNSGCIVYPTHLKPDSPDLDKIHKKLMIHYGLDKNQISPFIVNMPFRLISYDLELSRKKYKESSDFYRFFIDQTDLKASHLLVAVILENLIEGNTLGVPAQKFIGNIDFGYEFKVYDSFVQDLIKL